MRIQHVLALIGALTLSLSASAADGAANTAPATASASSSAPAADAFDIALGFYDLPDGRQLHVFSVRNKLYAKVDGGDRTQVVPVAERVLASPNGAVRLEFKGNGANMVLATLPAACL